MKPKRNFRLRPLHGAFAVVLVVVGLIVAFALGAFAGYHYPYRTLPRPPLPPGQKAPDCKIHVMGRCLPHKAGLFRNQASITATTQGPDLSNNDPIYGDGPWTAIGNKNAFVIFKVTEGTGYVDSTAAGMASYAKRHGLVVGGYDFLHVCGNDAAAEARTFVYWLKSDQLTGPNTLPGTGDAEYGGSGCNARAWIQTWADTVFSLTGRFPMIYTGAWWWQPHLGSYWPNPALAWISGYGVSYPYMPSGRSQLDLWQKADNGYNGYTYADLSTWRDGVAAFNAASSSGPPPDPYAAFRKVKDNLGHNIFADEYDIVKGWNDRHCLHPTIRNVCGFLNFRLKLLDGRLKAVTHNWQHDQLILYHRLARAKYIEREIAQTKPPWTLPSIQ